MKKPLTYLIAATLALGSIGTAQADWGRHHDYRPPMRGYYDNHYRGGGNWVGPAAVLAIAGAAIGVAAYNRAYAAPAPVYSAPPVYVQAPPPAANLWYYCGSSGQYYPYTNACPEGWQAVPAR